MKETLENYIEKNYEELRKNYEEYIAMEQDSMSHKLYMLSNDNCFMEWAFDVAEACLSGVADDKSKDLRKYGAT